MVGGVSLIPESSLWRAPFDGKFVGNFLQHFVACWIAPEKQVMCREVVAGDVGVILHARIAAELSSPMVDGVHLFRVGPRCDLFIYWRAGGTHHQKAIHERIIDRPLQAVSFAQFAT